MEAPQGVLQELAERVLRLRCVQLWADIQQMVADVGGRALLRLTASRYDVVVLDRDLPGVHGDEICRRLAA